MVIPETNCTYKNPKRPAYHEAGHLVALYMLTGSLTTIRPNKSRKSGKIAEYSQIFKEVCYWIAGGAAERVYCHLKALPLNTTMIEDLDILLDLSKLEWQLPFKQCKKGYPVCPTLDRLIKTAEYSITPQLRTYETILRVWSLTDYLIKNDLVKTNVLEDLQKDASTKRDILRILKTDIKNIEDELNNSTN